MGTIPRSPALGSKQLGCVEWSSYLGYPQLAMKTKQLCDTYLFIMSCVPAEKFQPKTNMHPRIFFARLKLMFQLEMASFREVLASLCSVLHWIYLYSTWPAALRSQSTHMWESASGYVQIGKTLTKPHRYSKPFGWSFFPVWRGEILMDDFKIGLKNLPSLCHHFSTDK